MPKSDMKNCSDYRELGSKMENEQPEEGEIVDEYDLIVSSDEELSMRQRIRELEAENEEIEQIAVISRSYNDKINPPHIQHLENSRAAQVPTDASSISSTEFVTPKKRKRRKSKDHKRKHCHHQQHQHHHHKYDYNLRSKKTHCKRRQKLFAKKHQKTHSERYTYKEIDFAKDFESPESTDSSSSLTDTEYSNKNWLPREETFDYDKYITRDTLRLAVARDAKESNKSCLKDKLLKQKQNESHNIEDRQLPVKDYQVIPTENVLEDEDDDDVQVIENVPEIQTIDDEDSADSMEEKELRLIALKSAVLKKHMTRKMRNAQSAYSPTDFDDMLSSGLMQQQNKLEDDLEVVDLEAEDSQNACVSASPIASPQLMILDDQEESQQMVDCKPVDMDIANSDSEDTTIGSWSKEVEHNFPSFPLMANDFAHNYQYGFYLPDLNELPPPPPGVEDYENVPPPPPAFLKIYNSQLQDMELDNEMCHESQEWLTNKEVCNSRETQELKSEESLKLANNEICKEEIDDEEEEALRALLLSKLQSPKNQQKKIKRPNDEMNESQEQHELESQNKKPTEFILKEAVKRLKIHSQAENSKEDSSLEDKHFEDKRLDTKTPECIETENKDSLNLMERLRNRLLMYRNQADAMKSEHVNEVSKESYGETDKLAIKTESSKEDCGGNYDEEKNDITEVMKTEAINPTCKNYDSSTQDHCPSYSTTPELCHNIDISDITRRLQQIKENVLSSTNLKLKTQKPVYNPELETALKPKEVSFEDGFIPKEPVVEETQPLLESNKQINLSLNRNLDTETNGIGKEDNPLAKNKTVEADYDATTHQTTFKVTISNSKALETQEECDIKATNSDISSKENKANNVEKNFKLKVNVNVKSKPILNSERFVKIINKPKEISTETKLSAVVKTSSVIKPVASKAPVTTAAANFSLLRPTKIVKPNKVINTNFDLNRRTVPQAIEAAKTKPNITKQETSLASTNAADNSRLITSLDQVKYMCKVPPFVISLQNSSNESSGDEWTGDCDSLYKPFYDYDDIASPLSLTLESPSRTPLRANSPIDTNMESNSSTKKDLNTKLDAFLKRARTSVNQQNKETQQTVATTNKTPLAVRHLPAAAQSEYRKLVHRMKLLENKRKTASGEENTLENLNCKQNETTLPSSEDLSKDKDSATTPKTSLVKKVLIRNANNTTPATSSTQETQLTNGSTEGPKFHKANVLRSYENLYAKFGAGIVNNLDKSLKLVEEAKKAKINKLKLETRLKELKAEMDLLQGKHKDEQQKISRIYPSICSTNEVITSLKQKRAKVFKAALNLGKTFKGEEYRLNNELKESINAKSKQLASEIKLVNSLKVQDILKIEAAAKSTDLKIKLVVEESLEEIIKTPVEESTTKSLKDTEEIKLKETMTEINSGIEDIKNKTLEETELNSNILNANVKEVDVTNNSPEKMLESQEEDTSVNLDIGKDCKENFVDETKEKDRKIDHYMSLEIEEKESTLPSNDDVGGNTELQDAYAVETPPEERETGSGEEDNTVEDQEHEIKKKQDSNKQSMAVASYISPLEHLRNIDSNMDPNGVVCPYDLMGNCEDVTCKYVHITSTKAKT